MLFSLEALKAEHGDCLLLHWGTAAAPRRLLIDGGPPGVYQDTLRPRLMQPSPLVAAVLSSVERSRELTDAAGAIGLRVNRAFGGGVIQAGDAANLARGLSVEVIGPNAMQIAELREMWRESLQTQAWAELAAFLDRNVQNLASIVLVVSRGRKRVLLTGDARGDHVLRGLQDAGVLTGATARFDVLKVPHHGSERNVTVDFFRRLPADHYIVSGNGKHGNPELATLRMLAEARGAARYTVHFTYRDGDHGLRQEIRTWKAEQRAAGRPVKTAFPRRDTRSLLVELGDERL